MNKRLGAAIIICNILGIYLSARTYGIQWGAGLVGIGVGVALMLVDENEKRSH